MSRPLAFATVGFVLAIGLLAFLGLPSLAFADNGGDHADGWGEAAAAALAAASGGGLAALIGGWFRKSPPAHPVGHGPFAWDEPVASVDPRSLPPAPDHSEPNPPVPAEDLDLMDDLSVEQ